MMIPAPNADFYNLRSAIIRGVAQVKQIRQVSPKRGKPFTACTLMALLGPSKQPRHRYYDCEVIDTVAAQEILKCKEACDAGRKVTIGFELGSAELRPFTYRAGDRKDEIGFTEKVDLIGINWLTIDDELKYQVEPRISTDDGTDSQSPSASGGNASEPAERIAAAS